MLPSIIKSSIDLAVDAKHHNAQGMAAIHLLITLIQLLWHPVGRPLGHRGYRNTVTIPTSALTSTVGYPPVSLIGWSSLFGLGGWVGGPVVHLEDSLSLLEELLVVSEKLGLFPQPSL